ncbi:MAG: 30S ribosomal protein S2 [bacterium]
MNDSKDLKKIKNLFDAGAHLGHKKNRVHPKAKKFIYRFEKGVSIIDLAQTADQINNAKDFLKDYVKKNTEILIVATKRIASDIASKISKEINLPYVTTKWMPGLLTNFNTIIKNVKRLKELKEEKESGAWNKLVKHERTKLDKEISKLDRFYGGIIDLEEVPKVLFILDSKTESNAVSEAKKTNTKIVAIIDTNSNPEEVDYPIIANDDSPVSVEYLLKDIVGQIKFKKGK